MPEPPAAPFFYVAGATATGKSALAVELATALGGVVIGCDPPQLYRDLPILTAQPEPELRARVPHHLVGMLSPEQEISAGWYARQAQPLLEELWEARVPAIVCGGSGLYLRALTHGLDDIPPTPPTVRERFAALPADAALAKLLNREPEAARWIALDNPRRVQRALELLEITGLPLAELRRREDRPMRPGIAGAVLAWPREELHARIDQRTAHMLESGAIEEVAAVRGLEMSSSFQQVIGLREIVSLLEQKIDGETCRDFISQMTRRYAKRQETWFRKHAGPEVRFGAETASGLAQCRKLADRWYEQTYAGEK